MGTVEDLLVAEMRLELLAHWYLFAQTVFECDDPDDALRLLARSRSITYRTLQHTP